MKTRWYVFFITSIVFALLSFYLFFDLDGSHCITNEYTVKSTLPCLDSTKGLIFYKTHKTGSSTVSSILWRKLCLSNSLNCFLPSDTNPGKIWDFSKNTDRDYLTRNTGTNGSGKPFDVWLHHIHLQDFAGDSDSSSSNYIHQHIRQPFLPVSIVRRPAHRFESAWHWYEHSKRLNMKLSTFIEQLREESRDPEKCIDKAAKLNKRFNMKYRTGLDATSEELTGQSMAQGPKAFTRSYSNLIGDNNIFLMVCDRFDESLLMLSLLLGWDQPPSSIISSDALQQQPQQLCSTHSCRVCVKSPLRFSSILYVKQKVQTYNHSLTTEEEALLDEVQPFDSLLYKKANDQLDAYIAAMGREWFKGELVDFQRILHAVSAYCHQHNEVYHDAVQPYLKEAGLEGKGDLFCQALLKDNRDNVQDSWKRIKKPHH